MCFRVKVIVIDGEPVSTGCVQVGPTLVRDWVPGEPVEPTPIINTERREIGWWKRLMRAGRMYGYDGGL